MKRTLLLIATLSLAVVSHGQNPKPATPLKPIPVTMSGEDAGKLIDELRQLIATLRIENANLKMSLLQQQANPIIQDKQMAIKDLEAANPGMRWDDQQGKLVAIPAPPPPPAKTPVPVPAK
jgi:hypothetical protein